jgi:hypothetical protein
MFTTPDRDNVITLHFRTTSRYSHNLTNFDASMLPRLLLSHCCQAVQAGKGLHDLACASGGSHKFFFYTSPYRRSIETYTAMAHEIPKSRILGVQEEVQLREQDFGNFQDAVGKAQEKSERLRFGRFFYRFPNGESGADVYDRCAAAVVHFATLERAPLFERSIQSGPATVATVVLCGNPLLTSSERRFKDVASVHLGSQKYQGT